MYHHVFSWIINIRSMLRDVRLWGHHSSYFYSQFRNSCSNIREIFQAKLDEFSSLNRIFRWLHLIVPSPNVCNLPSCKIANTIMNQAEFLTQVFKSPAICLFSPFCFLVGYTLVLIHFSSSFTNTDDVESSGAIYFHIFMSAYIYDSKWRSKMTITIF